MSPEELEQIKKRLASWPHEAKFGLHTAVVDARALLQHINEIDPIETPTEAALYYRLQKLEADNERLKHSMEVQKHTQQVQRDELVKMVTEAKANNAQLRAALERVQYDLWDNRCVYCDAKQGTDHDDCYIDTALKGKD